MKKRSINNNIIKTTYIFSILFYVLIIFLVFLVLNGDSIIDNSYNKRIDTLNNYVNKGQIYSANMEVLAYTDETTGKRIYTLVGCGGFSMWVASLVAEHRF